jgi:hypothetical protein
MLALNVVMQIHLTVNNLCRVEPQKV